MKLKLIIISLLVTFLAGCMTKETVNTHFLEVGAKYYINLRSDEKADDSEYGAYYNEFTIIEAGPKSWYLVEYVRGEEGRVSDGIGMVPTKTKRRIWLNIDHAISLKKIK